MSGVKRYRVWCLSYDDEEEHGRDVVSSSVPDCDRAGAIVATWANSAEDAAEAYAEYAHDHRDGWEDTWPLKFRVRCPDGTTEDFEVERDYSPTFSASAIERKRPQEPGS